MKFRTTSTGWFLAACIGLGIANGGCSRGTSTTAMRAEGEASDASAAAASAAAPSGSAQPSANPSAIASSLAPVAPAGKPEAEMRTVMGETDAPSLARAKAHEPVAKGNCPAALAALVESTPEVKKLIAGPKNPADGHVANVVLEDGEAEGSRGLPAMLFRVVEKHRDHQATIGQFEVDFAGHAVLQVDPANPDTEGKKLKPEPAKLEAAVRACPEKFWD